MTEAINPTPVQRIAADLLRETGYNASILKGQGEVGETWSRAMGLWKDACKLVKESFSETEADRMIESSWNPNKVAKLAKIAD